MSRSLYARRGGVSARWPVAGKPDRGKPETFGLSGDPDADTCSDIEGLIAPEPPPLATL